MRKTIIAILAVLLLICAVSCNADVNSKLFGKTINLKLAKVNADKLKKEIDDEDLDSYSLSPKSITFESGEKWSDVVPEYTSDEIDGLYETIMAAGAGKTGKDEYEAISAKFDSIFTGDKIVFTSYKTYEDDTITKCTCTKCTCAFVSVTGPEGNVILITKIEKFENEELKNVNVSPGMYYISTVDLTGNTKEAQDAFLAGIPLSTDSIIEDGTYYLFIEYLNN